MLLIIPQILFLGITAYQDFKDRAISWFLPLCLTLCGIANYYLFKNTAPLDWVLNAFFILLQLAIICIYLIIKTKTINIKLTTNYLGLGDILFLLALTPFFEFKTFILLLSGGLIFSLIGHLILNGKKQQNNLPLAGWLSIYYSLYFLISIFF